MARFVKSVAKHIVCGAACFALLGSALAGPEDDYKLGIKRYRDGDIVEAMSPLQKSADAGHAAAQALYGYLLDISDFDDDAVVYYKKSAEQGNPDGQLGYGLALINGEGIAPNVKEGGQWVRKAAEAGLAAAENQMALMELDAAGLPGRNNEEALKWINKAVKNEFIPAIEGLADAYRNGTFGLSVDAKMAEELLDKARKIQGIDKRKRRGRK